MYLMYGLISFLIWLEKLFGHTPISNISMDNQQCKKKQIANVLHKFWK